MAIGLVLLVAGPFFAMSSAFFAGSAYAWCCSCACPACIPQQHNQTRQHITNEFKQHQNWMIDTFFNQYIRPAMQEMTEQLTAVGYQQVEIIGAFLDAKHQLETQRLFQEKQADAHKAYHPSEGICTFGTGAKALAASDRLAEYNATALTQQQLQRQLLTDRRSAAASSGGELIDRLNQFKTTYCNPNDNNNGLNQMCGNGGPPDRQNRDIDFTRLVDSPLTLELNYRDGGAPTPDEEDVIALSNNLFSHRLFKAIQPSYLDKESNQEDLLDARAVIAKRSVALNSFNSIVGMKSEGSSGSGEFLGAILKELAMPDNEVLEMLGDNPSYFAQMEVLSKKIYQDPRFYANLYDKPVNVARKGVAMQAIQLMQDRDLYRSQLRTEAMLSILLETELMKIQEDVEGRLTKITGQEG